MEVAFARVAQDGSCWLIVLPKWGYSIGLERKVLDEKWELVLGMGNTRKKAWEDYYTRRRLG